MDIVRVSGSVEAGHQHVDAVAQADEKAGEQRDNCLLYTSLGFINYTVIWRYFSWTNQTLAMIVLWAASMYLFKEKQPTGRS